MMLVPVTTLVSLSLATAMALKFDAPKGWVAKPSASSMRVAEFALPKAAGDAEDASVVVYFFGAGQGGTVEANLDRWLGQMTQPDGRASKDVAKTSRFTANGLNVTLLDVSGTYVAQMTPGSTERHNSPNFRLLAAVVDTREGPYFVKVTGPAKTVAQWHDSVMAFLKSVRIG
jgi:hypothetical protein